MALTVRSARSSRVPSPFVRFASTIRCRSLGVRTLDTSLTKHHRHLKADASSLTSWSGGGDEGKRARPPDPRRGGHCGDLPCVAWVSVQVGLVSRSPLYDGLAEIPPYRWVQPPPERQGNNEVPEPESFEVQISTSGQADPGSVTTSDGRHTSRSTIYLPHRSRTCSPSR